MPSITIREDEFSIQGFLPQDGRVFLRRLKHRDASVLTDASFGSQSDATAVALLTDFLRASGGVRPGVFRVRDVAPGITDQRQICARFDRLKIFMRSTLQAFGLELVNAMLDLNHEKFDAVFEISAQGRIGQARTGARKLKAL